MPNYTIHLAAANAYAKKHKIKDLQAFIKGNVAPDILRIQGIQHPYKRGRELDSTDIKKALTDRLDLVKYLGEFEVKTDFQKGAFLHLLVDQYCSLHVTDFEKFQRALDNGADVQASIHKSMEKHTDYLVKKYNIDFEPKELKTENDNWTRLMDQRVGVDDIFDIEKLEEFIDKFTDTKIEDRITETNCIFCRIVRGEIPSNKVYEDEYTLAFFDINPASEYHTLVIPKKHYVNMFDVPEDEATNVMRTIKKIIALYEQKIGLTDVNVVNNSGAGAHQDVFHLHFHIVPRLSEDKLGAPWTRYPDLREKFGDMLEGLK